MVPSRGLRVNRVEVLPAYPAPLDVPRHFKVGDDFVSGPFRYSDISGNLSGSMAWEARDVAEDMAVIGDECPTVRGRHFFRRTPGQN